MCSPHLSFLVDRFAKIFYKDKMNSHSMLADHFGLDEDKMLKVDYNWVTKEIDILNENKDQNSTCAFDVKDSHYRAIDAFINKKMGTKAKVIKWLAINRKADKKVKNEMLKILDYEGQKLYKKFTDLAKLFNTHPNHAWSVANGTPQ